MVYLVIETNAHGAQENTMNDFTLTKNNNGYTITPNSVLGRKVFNLEQGQVGFNFEEKHLGHFFGIAIKNNMKLSYIS